MPNCLCPDIIQVAYGTRFKITSLVNNKLSTNRAAANTRGPIGMTSGDVGSGVADSDPRNIVVRFRTSTFVAVAFDNVHLQK